MVTATPWNLSKDLNRRLRPHSSASTMAPTTINVPPTNFITEKRSPRKSAANTMTKATLSLSMGATREAGPVAGRESSKAGQSCCYS